MLSLVSFSLETLPNLEPGYRTVLRGIEIVTVILFTIEYILRIVVAQNRIRFLFSFYGIIDLLAIVPFYLAVGIDLRSVRVFRLFRLIRILKIVRFNRAIRRFSKAFQTIKSELFLFLTSTAFLLYISAVGIYYFENSAQPDKFASVFHSLWWATTTLTTVGYGDVYPITVGGRIFTFLVLMIGLGIVAVLPDLLRQRCR